MISYGHGTFILFGDSGTILTSPDGKTWTSQNLGTNNNISAINYANGIFVAVGNDYKTNAIILTSADALTVEFSTYNGMATFVYSINTVEGKNNFYVISGWTIRDMEEQNQPILEKIINSFQATN
ncbi:MAG: hypothetical protein ACLQSX_00800 [Smithella sp.]